MSLKRKQSKLETGSNGSWFLTEEHEGMLAQRVMTPFHVLWVQVREAEKDFGDSQHKGAVTSNSNGTYR